MQWSRQLTALSCTEGLAEAPARDFRLQRVPQFAATAAPAILLHANVDRALRTGKGLSGSGQAHVGDDALEVLAIVHDFVAGDGDVCAWGEDGAQIAAQILLYFQEGFLAGHFQNQALFAEEGADETAILAVDFEGGGG